MSGADYAFPIVDSVLSSSINVNDRATKVAEVQNQILNTESTSFDSAYAPATAASKTALTYGMVLDRNNTIQSIANDLTMENKSKMSGTRDTYARQAEINEWQAQDKFDTLFFLQLLFIYLAAMVVSLYLRQVGMFPSSIVNILAGLGLVIIGLILWNRASYTSSSRDQRYWNRRFMGLGDAKLNAQIQCNLST